MTIMLVFYSALAVRTADADTTLTDGIYAFKILAHKQGREKPYDDPPVDCELKTDGNAFTLTPTTNMEWTAKGTISNGTVRLTIDREHMDDWVKRGFRFNYIGSVVASNHVKGTHEGYAGTNMYISGTWELMRKNIQQESGPYGSPATGSPSGQP